METKVNHNFKSLVGQQFSFLQVLARAEKFSKKGSAYWACQCVCGKEAVVRTDHLKAGKIKSCGCKVAELVSTAIRKPLDTRGIYNCMKERVLYPSTPSYEYYRKHNIRICAGWLGEDGYNHFLADMGERPAGKTLDRINGWGNYSCGHCEECKQNDWPANVRWCTAREQMRNRTDNVYLEHDGQRRLVVEWSEITGISYKTLRNRMKKGWPSDKVIKVPTVTQLKAA